MLLQDTAPLGESTQPRRRYGALDAVRGLAIVVMLLVMNPGPADDLPGQLQHAGWHGLTVADLAFPLFLFAVGASMTLSRRGLDARHVAFRVVVLAALGLGLASLKYGELHATGVLQHIAGAYLLAFLVLRLPRRLQAPVAIGILVVLWVGFVVWAGPSEDPWGESGTLAHAVDGWVYGDFSAEGVLSTVASAVSVVGGALAGRMTVEASSPRALTRLLSHYAVGLLAAGLLLSVVVPLNKQLWTPSFTVVTLGASCALLAVGTWLIDVRRVETAARPLRHLGLNPTLIYLLSMTVLFSMRNVGVTGASPIGLEVSDAVEPLVLAAGWVALWWLLAWGLHRRRIFLRV